MLLSHIITYRHATGYGLELGHVTIARLAPTRRIDVVEHLHDGTVVDGAVMDDAHRPDDCRHMGIQGANIDVIGMVTADDTDRILVVG